MHRSDENLPREGQLAWKIAEVASEQLGPTAAVADMLIDRIIDNAAVAKASLARGPVVSARAQAEAHLENCDRVRCGLLRNASPEIRRAVGTS